MAFGDIQSSGFNNLNSKRQTGRVQNFQSINKNPPMAPQFSSIYGNMNAGGVNAKQAQMNQRALAQSQINQPQMQPMNPYGAQDYANYVAMNGNQSTAPIGQNLQPQSGSYGAQDYANYVGMNGNQSTGPVGQNLQPQIGSYGAQDYANYVSSNAQQPVSKPVYQTPNIPIPTQEKVNANIPADDIAFYKSLYMSMKPSDVNYSQTLTPTKYGGTFGDSYGAGFDKWFEQNYLRKSSFSKKK